MVYDDRTQQVQSQTGVHSKRIHRIAALGGGRFAIISEDKTLTFLHGETLQVIRSIGFSAPPTDVSWAPTAPHDSVPASSLPPGWLSVVSGLRRGPYPAAFRAPDDVPRCTLQLSFPLFLRLPCSAGPPCRSPSHCSARHPRRPALANSGVPIRPQTLDLKRLYVLRIAPGQEEDSPVELQFQDSYGQIVSHHWFGKGYLLVAFNRGQIVVQSVYGREVMQEVCSQKISSGLRCPRRSLLALRAHAAHCWPHNAPQLAVCRGVARVRPEAP